MQGLDVGKVFDDFVGCVILFTTGTDGGLRRDVPFENDDHSMQLIGHCACNHNISGYSVT
jgi:hypothetical protein